MSDEGNTMEPNPYARDMNEQEPQQALPRHWYLRDYYHVESSKTCACEASYGPLKWSGVLKHDPGEPEPVHIHQIKATGPASNNA